MLTVAVFILTFSIQHVSTQHIHVIRVELPLKEPNGAFYRGWIEAAKKEAAIATSRWNRSSVLQIEVGSSEDIVHYHSQGTSLDEPRHPTLMTLSVGVDGKWPVLKANRHSPEVRC
jgi:hypothetical protein